MKDLFGVDCNDKEIDLYLPGPFYIVNENANVIDLVWNAFLNFV